MKYVISNIICLLLLFSSSAFSSSNKHENGLEIILIDYDAVLLSFNKELNVFMESLVLDIRKRNDLSKKAIKKKIQSISAELKELGDSVNYVKAGMMREDIKHNSKYLGLIEEKEKNSSDILIGSANKILHDNLNNKFEEFCAGGKYKNSLALQYRFATRVPKSFPNVTGEYIEYLKSIGFFSKKNLSKLFSNSKK